MKWLNSVTKAYEDSGVIEIHNPHLDFTEPPKTFTFDAVFSERSTQRQIYDVCAAPVVQSVLEGYNGTIFAYGQTGAGKTHTMEGSSENEELKGIIPNAIQHIFDHVSLNTSNEKYLIRASYFEIYNEEIRDLLSYNSNIRLELRESNDLGVYVKDLKSFVVKSITEVEKLLSDGKKNRSVGSTMMNQTSSRSHSVFSIVIECCSSHQDGHIRVGKLNLVDLAGSERQTKTGAAGIRLKEATKINLSLSALGNVISALVDGKPKHVPYRDSKLTRILQDSLGGNTKTVMCANAGPADYNYDETLSTLRYASRAKSIKNKPRINEDPKDAMLRQYQDEISKLRNKLAVISGGNNLINTDDEKLSESFNSLNIEKIRLQVEKEKDEIVAASKKEMEFLKNEQTKTQEERLHLQQQLDEQHSERLRIENEKMVLCEKLAMLEEQVMKGGEIMDKASKQEAELRKAEQDLVARRENELQLSRAMEEQEEVTMLLEQKYSSLSEEVNVKSKKLQRVWRKYQECKTEIEDIQKEFQSERDDMLETIRALSKQLKLKELVISHFIPMEYSEFYDDEADGGLAKWDEEKQEWTLPRLDLSGKSLRIQRIVGANSRNLPDTEHARRRKLCCSNPRYRYKNILDLDIENDDNYDETSDMNEQNTRLLNMLNMNIFGDMSPTENHHTNTKQKSPLRHYDKTSVSKVFIKLCMLSHIELFCFFLF